MTTLLDLRNINKAWQTHDYTKAADLASRERVRKYERLGEEKAARSGYQAAAGITTGTGTGTGTGASGRPGKPDLPEFEAPEYDERKVASKAQKIAAPRVRQLREAVRSVQATPFENPNVKRMTVSQALQGYGTGLESVMGGARRGAVAEYGQEYGKEFTAAQMNFQTQVQGEMAQYGNLWSEYLTNLKANLANSSGGAGLMPSGVRSQSSPAPAQSPPRDLNDPTRIGSRVIR